MKVTISDFIIAFFDLLEAEIRAFKSGSEEFLEKEYKNFQKTIFKSSISILGIVISGILFLVAIISLAAGIFLIFDKLIGTIGACFLVSLIFFIIAGCLLWFLKKKNE